jgi:hypothetical protein
VTNAFFANIDCASRRLYVDQAQAWLIREAARLHVSPDDIDAAIRQGGWLPNEIEQIEQSEELRTTRRRSRTRR